MKLLSYALEHRMEPRLAFSLNGYAVDVMRAALWMKAERKAQDYLNLPSSLRLALEDWPRTRALLSDLIEVFQSLELSQLKAYDRQVAMPETEIAFFSPVPDPPGLRHFQAFGPTSEKGFSFGNTQTLLGHGQALEISGLHPSLEMAAIAANPRSGQDPEIAGFCVVNNWYDPQAQDDDFGGRWGLATSLGPYLVTADEIENQKMGLGYTLEAQIMHDRSASATGHFKDMQLSFQDMFRLAQRTRIQAGDLFFSGSPLALTQTLENASLVEVEIQSLGQLSTPITKLQN